MSMDRKIAESLLPVVNDSLDLEALQDYASYRIEQVHLKALEKSTNMEEILRIQGAIKELRRFASLREEVVQDSRNV